MHSRLLNCCFLFALATVTNAARAEVKLPTVLAAHMVIQRDKPVHVWGAADAGEQVTVTFRGNHASTTASEIGRWSLYLPPGAAGGPFTLTVQGKNTITLNDVLVGDLWVASGQSNMEFPMDPTMWSHGPFHAQQEIAAANHPRLRLFHVENTFADYPMDDVKATTWTPATPESVLTFSAVGYFFGRDLLEKEQVPIGIVEANWGGTPAEAWTSLKALSADSSLMPVFAARAGMMDPQAETLLKQKVEAKEVADAKAAGKTPPVFPWHPDPNPWAPAALFNGMIAPITPLPIRGVIWYQGESNTDAMRAPIYGHLFETMIRDWRAQWALGDFPFLYVQIANFISPDEWATVREGQRKTLALANTGMAVTIDIGNPDNVHPQDKQSVGHRLALWAEDLSYGAHVEDSGPLFRQAVPENGAMHIWFDHAASGLMAKGGELQGFEVAGPDGKFVIATAAISGEDVIAKSASVAQPMYVRYGWASNPQCNLFNKAGLPASPFSSKN